MVDNPAHPALVIINPFSIVCFFLILGTLIRGHSFPITFSLGLKSYGSIAWFGLWGQRPEARGQRPEARGQRPEARGQRPEARGQRRKPDQKEKRQFSSAGNYLSQALCAHQIVSEQRQEEDYSGQSI